MSAIGKMLANKIREIPYLTAGWTVIFNAEKAAFGEKGDPETFEQALVKLEESEDGESEEATAMIIKAFDVVAETARKTL